MEKLRSDRCGGRSETSFNVPGFRWRKRKRYLSKVGWRDSAGCAVRCGPGGSKLRFDRTFTRLEATKAPRHAPHHIRACLQNKCTTTGIYLYIIYIYIPCFTTPMSIHKNSKIVRNYKTELEKATHNFSHLRTIYIFLNKI